MNNNDFEAVCYLLWFLIKGYFKLDTIFICLNQITKNDKISFLCLITYFIFLSETEWNYLFKFSLPIAFWSVVFKNQ